MISPKRHCLQTTFTNRLISVVLCSLVLGDVGIFNMYTCRICLRLKLYEIM